MEIFVYIINLFFYYYAIRLVAVIKLLKLQLSKVNFKYPIVMLFLYSNYYINIPNKYQYPFLSYQNILFIFITNILYYLPTSHIDKPIIININKKEYFSFYHLKNSSTRSLFFPFVNN